MFTTTGRCHTVGPCVDPNEVRTSTYDWVVLLKNAKFIDALFFSNPVQLYSLCAPVLPPVIETIGACGETHQDPLPSALPTPQYPDFDLSALLLGTIPGRSHPDLFLTHAPFENIRKIEVCCGIPFCTTGLLIHYEEAPPQVLGQFYWNPLSKPEHKCIYEGNGTDLSRICFQMSKNYSTDGYARVDHVYVLDDLAVFTPKEGVVSFKIGNVGIFNSSWIT